VVNGVSVLLYSKEVGSSRHITGEWYTSTAPLLRGVPDVLQVNGVFQLIHYLEVPEIC